MTSYPANEGVVNPVESTVAVTYLRSWATPDESVIPFPEAAPDASSKVTDAPETPAVSAVNVTSS